MLYNRSLQTLINAVVILLLVGFAVVGLVGFIPTRSPLGPLIGKMSSNVKSTSSMLGALDPKAVGKSVKENPNFLVEMMKYMNPGGTATAVNENPEWLAEVLSYVDGKV